MTRSTLSLDDYVAGVQAGDRAIVAKAITLVESTRSDHRELAAKLLGRLLPSSPSVRRVGISGVPGVGKSTFIEALGSHLLQMGHKVAVLAVDPSSVRSGGSIMGDKTRMQRLSTDPRAFIRPTPSAGSLGGVARRTREAMVICESAGFDVILVETVGVGQSEVEVAQLVDVFVALMLAGAGDELQGIKRGILEVVDVVAFNKADAAGLEQAKRAAASLEQVLHLFSPRWQGWSVPVRTCSALTGDGVAEIWTHVEALRASLASDGRLAELRARQRVGALRRALGEGLLEHVEHDARMQAQLAQMEAAVSEDRDVPTRCAEQLLHAWIGA